MKDKVAAELYTACWGYFCSMLYFAVASKHFCHTHVTSRMIRSNATNLYARFCYVAVEVVRSQANNISF